MTQAPIDLEFLLACGVVFRSMANTEAGWKVAPRGFPGDPLWPLSLRPFISCW